MCWEHTLCSLGPNWVISLFAFEMNFGADGIFLSSVSIYHQCMVNSGYGVVDSQSISTPNCIQKTGKDTLICIKIHSHYAFTFACMCLFVCIKL